MTRQTGFIFAFASYFLYSLNSPIARQAFLDGMLPDTLLAYRFTIGAILFLLTITFTNLGKAKDGEKPLDRFGFFTAIVSGLLNGGAIYFYFHSLNLMPASFVSVLGIGFYIVMVIALLTLSGEEFTLFHGIRMVLGLGGIWLLVGPSGELGSRGVLLIALGSFLFAVHMISMQWYLSGYNIWTVATVVVCSTSCLLVSVWLWNGLQAGELDFAIPTMSSWLAVIFLAVCSSWVGRFFSYSAISVLGSGELALMTPTETLLAILWSVIFLRERLDQLQWVGAALIITGVGIVGLKYLYTSFNQGSPKPAPDSAPAD